LTSVFFLSPADPRRTRCERCFRICFLFPTLALIIRQIFSPPFSIALIPRKTRIWITDSPFELLPLFCLGRSWRRSTFDVSIFDVPLVPPSFYSFARGFYAPPRLDSWTQFSLFTETGLCIRALRRVKVANLQATACPPVFPQLSGFSFPS